MHRRPAHVRHNEPLTPNVRRLVVEIEDGPFVHAPGQAVVLEATNEAGAVVRAPYSIASAPGELGANLIEVAVARDAPGSRALTMHELGVGAMLEVVGPVGSFLRNGEAENAPALFVAAGTGLSPLRSMLAAELARRPDKGPRLVLLYGARTESETLWRDDLTSWPQRFPRLTTLITLSRPSDGWSGRRGWVQAHLDEAAALAGADAYAFVCGPEAMVQGAMGVLREKHLPEMRVLRERYS